MWTPALILAAVGTGCVGGVVYAFSAFVMPALDRLPAADAIRAMQSINRMAERAPLGIAILVPLVAGIALSVQALGSWEGSSSVAVLAGTALYLVVGLGVTGAVNIPLNNRLARTPALGTAAATAQDAATWAAYTRPWSRANHLRTAGALLGSAAFTLAALLR